MSNFGMMTTLAILLAVWGFACLIWGALARERVRELERQLDWHQAEIETHWAIIRDLEDALAIERRGSWQEVLRPTFEARAASDNAPDAQGFRCQCGECKAAQRAARMGQLRVIEGAARSLDTEPATKA